MRGSLISPGIWRFAEKLLLQFGGPAILGSNPVQHLIGDPNYSSGAARSQRREELYGLLEGLLLGMLVLMLWLYVPASSPVPLAEDWYTVPLVTGHETKKDQIPAIEDARTGPAAGNKVGRPA